MKPWRVDFVAGPRHSSAVAWVALLAAAFVVGDSLWSARALSQQATKLEAAAREPAAVVEAPRRDPAVQRELAHAEVITRRLSLPWGELFRAIESASGQRVALLSIDPDAQSGRLTITGEAGDQRAVIAYLTRLSRLPHLRQVHLLQHEAQEEAPQAVRFVVSAQWRALP